MKKYKCVLCGFIARTCFCPDCLDKARAYHEVICQYIKEHPKPTMVEVYGETNVPLTVINGLLEMGWLELVNQKVKIPEPRNNV